MRSHRLALVGLLLIGALALQEARATSGLNAGSDPIAAVPTHVLGRILQALGAELDVPSGSIELVAAEEVVWPDTCLGLPAPELCAPGPTPGYRITLRALGQEYVYHSDRSGMFRYAGPGDAPGRPERPEERKR
jgi:hypothetical protein